MILEEEEAMSTSGTPCGDIGWPIIPDPAINDPRRDAVTVVDNWTYQYPPSLPKLSDFSTRELIEELRSRKDESELLKKVKLPDAHS